MPSKIGTAEEALAARLALLAKEKEHNRIADAIKAERRALLVVLLMKSYTFQSPNGHSHVKGSLRHEIPAYHLSLHVRAYS
ncbi:putative DUF899-domain-containing protein [Seiridium unicorne]|uniref:DUF899-domain-containing protein n=1 Tax=Seiridium unicorne TaxID=138068 RepID=A0ABR2UQD3_9PEZI